MPMYFKYSNDIPEIIARIAPMTLNNVDLENLKIIKIAKYAIIYPELTPVFGKLE